MHRHLPRDLRIGYTILNVQKSVEIWEFSRNPPFLQHHPAAPPNTRTSGTRAHDLKITIAPPTGRFCLVNIVASNADLCCPLFVEQTSSRDMIWTRGFTISQEGKVDKFYNKLLGFHGLFMLHSFNAVRFRWAIPNGWVQCTSFGVRSTWYLLVVAI